MQSFSSNVGCQSVTLLSACRGEFVGRALLPCLSFPICKTGEHCPYWRRGEGVRGCVRFSVRTNVCLACGIWRDGSV